MIPVNTPLISKDAQNYVLDCLRSGWVSSAGSYIKRFEEDFASYLGCAYGVTTTSGTTALHLALTTYKIGKGDEVILPDLTIAACAFAICYTGAIPVVVDVDPKTGNIDPDKIEEKITKRTKAIMVVHLYGHPADMIRILPIAKKHNLLIIEDAAEAHGAEIRMQKWEKAGSIGDVGCFSFYGNKIITTGEGGMVVTNDEKIYKRLCLLKDLAHSPRKRFLHEEIGYNYRMTNLQAALGLAQLIHIKSYIQKKQRMAKLYNEGLKDIKYLELPGQEEWAKNVYWMYAIRLARNAPCSRDKFCYKLKENGVDTRNFFIPLHKQPIFMKMGLFKNEKCPVSTDLSQRGLYIPSGLALTYKQIEKVIQIIKKILKS